MNEGICIIDYGIGSFFSLKNSLDNCKCKSFVCDDPSELSNFKYAILPGVGNYKSASKLLLNFGWDKSIKNFLSHKDKKIMGICLGFQILFENSEESEISFEGLGLLKGTINKLIQTNSHRIPHVGWNELKVLKSNHFLEKRFNDLDLYFCHSYALKFQKDFTTEQFDEYAVTEHGSNKFISTFRSKNIYGCQFHPEKSSFGGVAFWKNFFK
tara:strand:- start:494 stop:1129 length:636 start_codon:yes stop_codon:yes gene_type:complete